MPRPGGSGGADRALRISAWLTGIYFFVELGIGLATGSIAVISDAFHTFSAVGGVVLALVAARIARRPASLSRTYGSYRAEVIGALWNGIFLLGMAILVIVMGAMRLNHPIELPPIPLIVAAVGGLVTETISLRLLFTDQKGNLNVRGAFWHVVQTFVGSILILITAGVITFTGFLAIDPILGIAFGVVLLWASWGIIRDAIAILMEGSPPGFDVEGAMLALGGLDGVSDVHHVHVWALTDNVNVFSAHLRTDDAAAAGRLLNGAHDLLRERFGVRLSTLQVETVCLDEAAAADLDVARRHPTPHRHGPDGTLTG
jgi:cobalt-zinc-cadmium efflux system protein